MISAFLLISTTAFADLIAKPDCSVAGLTNNCQYFSDHREQAKIELPDKTAFPNYMYSGHPLAPDSQAVKALAANAQVRLKASADIFRILDSLPPESKVSDDFKMALINAVTSPMISQNLTAWASNKPNVTIARSNGPSATVMVPWPPKDENSEAKPVALDQFIQYLESLPEPQKDDLKKRVAEVGNHPTMFGNLSGYGFPPPPAITQERKDRIQYLFKFARQAVLDEISQGRAFGELSSDEQSEYRKVESVELMSPEQSAMMPTCRTKSSMAYFGDYHKFCVCPYAYNYPDSALVLDFGHEISHSIDPCMVHVPLLKVNLEKVRQLPQNVSSWPDALRGNADFIRIISRLQLEQSPYMNTDLSLQVDDPNSIDELAKMGFYEVVDQGVPLERYPQQATLSCLDDKLGLRKTTGKELNLTADAYIRDLQGQPLTANEDLSRLKQDVLKKMERDPDCVATVVGKSHAQEAMADAWGSKVLGRWLTLNPPQNLDQKMAAIFWRMPCSNQPVFPSNDTNSASVRAKAYLDDPHPSGMVLLNKIILTEPRVQASMGCEPDTQLDCLRTLGTQGPIKATPAADKGTEEGTTR